MSHAISTSNITSAINPGILSQKVAQPGMLSKFMTWCEEEEKNRFLWLGVTFFGLIGMAVPCTLFAILVFGGNNFNLWILTCALNSPILAITLAAQPTKITLPALTFVAAADLLIIIGCAVSYLMS